MRVGLEDNFYLPNGEMARSNGDLIAKAREMTEDVGRRVATVDEARELLGHPRSGDAANERCPLEGRSTLSLTSPAFSRAASARSCWPTSAPTCVKVEDTGMGDYVRWSQPVYEGAAESAGSALFLALNRNKRSIRIDLKNDARQGGAAAPRPRIRRAARVLPPRACSTASAWATRRCAPRTPGSSTARSAATARTAPTATGRATT